MDVGEMIQQLESIAEQPVQIQSSTAIDWQEYDGGIIHIAFAVHKGQFHLVFGLLELYPTGVPIPNSSKQYSENAKEPYWSLVCRRLKVNIQDAQRWYEFCLNNNAFVYSKKASDCLDFSNPHPTKLLGQEPSWPNMVVPHEKAEVSALPFISRRWQCLKVHHLISLELSDIPESLHQACFEMLKAHLFIDITEWSELLGSIHLVAPNPILNHILESGKNKDPDKDTVSITIETFPGKQESIRNFKIILLENRSTGDTHLNHLSIDLQGVQVDFPDELEQTTLFIYSPKYGLVYRSGPHYYLKAVDLRMNAITSNINVHTDSESFKVSKYQSTPISIGEISGTKKARDILLDGRKQRKINAAKRTQRWFSNSQSQARKELRELLQNSDEKLLLVDPYFGAADLEHFAIAVGNVQTKIQVLTSAAFLKTYSDKDTNKEHCDLLNESLSGLSARKEAFPNAIEIKVMTGKKADIHDRLLWLDNYVWLLGSSLNEFGSRGTMLVRLPEPDLVMPEISRFYDKAEIFDQWFEKRKQKRQGCNS